MLKWITLLSGIVSIESAIDCPYFSFTDTDVIRVADEYCTNSTECYVDNKCKLIDDISSDQVDYTAVGNMKNYNGSFLNVTASRLNLNTFNLPPNVVKVQFLCESGLDLSGVVSGSWDNTQSIVITSRELTLSNEIKWPPQLQHLEITCGVTVTNIPQNLPATLDYIDIYGAGITDLTYLPKNNLSHFGIHGSKLEEITHKDLRNISRLNLAFNPLRTLAFVQLSPNLTGLHCMGCILSNITIDNSSFEALNSLRVINTFEGCPEKSFCINKNISTNPMKCSAIGGQLRSLSNAQSNMSATACVVSYTQAPDGIQASVSTATSIIVIIASMIIFALVIALFFYVKRAKERDDDSSLDLSEIYAYRLEKSDISVTSQYPLGAGGFGEVWLGLYRSQQVAIKRLKSRDPRKIQIFINEISLWATLDSAYIIKLRGACWDRPIDMECVMDYMNEGDLRTYLTKHSQDEFTWSEKLKCISCIVQGLLYLHTYSPPIIHRDLKSSNVLLDSVKGTQITDFGISRLVDDEDKTMTTPVGTYQWMAPEVLSRKKYSLAADIYSFGIILSEFCTHELPFSTMSEFEVYSQVPKGGVYPSFGENAPEWIKDIAMQCLQLNPDDRPTALELTAMLHQYESSNNIQ